MESSAQFGEVLFNSHSDLCGLYSELRGAASQVITLPFKLPRKGGDDSHLLRPFYVPGIVPGALF